MKPAALKSPSDASASRRLSRGMTATTWLGIGRDGSDVVGVVIWNAGWRAVLSLPDDPEFGLAAGQAVRAAVPTDLDRLTEYWVGFVRDAAGRSISDAEGRAIAESRLDRTYVWQSSEPVSMAVASGPHAARHSSRR